MHAVTIIPRGQEVDLARLRFEFLEKTEPLPRVLLGILFLKHP